jgi:hypothetical protein
VTGLRGARRRPRRAGVTPWPAAILAVALLAACDPASIDLPSDAGTPTSDAATPLEPGTPGGAPTLDGDGVVVASPDAASSPAPSSSPEGAESRAPEEPAEDDDEGSTADLDGPSTMPTWMTKPQEPASCPSATVRVDDAEELQDALDDAGPGTVIQLAAGVYLGEFATTASGTAARPARLCGPANAVLDGESQTGGYVLHLDGAEHWVLQGFTVRNGQKGVMADGTTGTTIAGLTVYGIGDEAIHLRGHSTDNLVTGNVISDTGRRRAKFGEGVYIGTAHSNWCDVTDCDPDLSDRNQVVGNVIYATSSEAVDLKEGTSDGVVSGNQFDGSLITGADSWLDAKGNDWTVADNAGRASPLDGFQTHDVYDGWGTRNEFTGNSGSLDDDDGLLVALRPVNENVVRCSNRLTGGTGGLTNVDCR